MFLTLSPPCKPKISNVFSSEKIKYIISPANKLNVYPEKQAIYPIKEFPILERAPLLKKSPIEFPHDIIIIDRNILLRFVTKDINYIQSKIHPAPSWRKLKDAIKQKNWEIFNFTLS